MALFRRPKKAVRPRVITINNDEDDEMDDLPAPEIVNNNGNTTTTTHTTTTTISNNSEVNNKPVKPFTVSKKAEPKESKSEDKSSKKQTVLSFDDEFEGDDGEVFKVKKSSVSRRLIKQRDREKKSEGSSYSAGGSSSGSTFKTFQSHKISFGGFKEEKESSSGIKNENSLISNNNTSSNNSGNISNKKSEDFIRILNGRDAVATTLEEEDMENDHDEDDEEDEDYEDNNDGGVKFRSSSQRDAASEAVRLALEKGQIPDASLIHEARKRRQQARESGAAVEFIPVDNVQKYRGEKSRLVREDDNDRSGDEDEEEERLDFATATNAAQIAREKRREAFDAAQDEERDRSSAEESDAEMDEWEKQQIRKGVTKTQMQNVASEVFQQQSYLYSNNDYTSGSYYDSAYPSYPSTDVLLSNSSDISNTISNNRTKNKNQQDLFNSSKNSRVLKVDDIVAGNKKLTPEIILSVLGDRLQKLKISKEAHEGALSRMEADLNLADKELEEAHSAKPALSSRFALYQNLRGYVTDLVDCLRCKVPQIETLENKMLELMKNQTERLAERRRQDTKDQLEEVKATRNILGGTPVTVPPPSKTEAKTRRAAEREGRRTRRRRIREIKDFKGHKEGLSSDDEEMESELNNFKMQRDSITLEAQNLFRDVVEDFGTIEGILSHFEEWRDGDFDSYKESYAYLCVPKSLAPILRSYLLYWDPFTDDFSMTKFPWIKSLANFGYRDDESIENLSADPDSRIIPDVAEKIIVPWITRVVKAKWDPLSASQTKKLVNVVRRCINEWSVIPTCKSIQALMSTIVTKFKDAVDNDVYIHLFPKQSGTNKCSPEYIFASRQFWSSVKLLDNMSSWAGLLSDKPLHILALDALLTRYILLGLRTAADLSDSAERAKGVVNVLPRSWLTREKGNEVPNGLLQLTNCLVSIVQNTDFALAVNRVAIPEIANVLKSIGAITEAQLVLQKYS